MKEGEATNEWPASGLETLGACPVCGSDAREPLHLGLQDRIFHSAPGKWDMYRCDRCGTGYLDPRPTEDSIHLAYIDYHTHEHHIPEPAEKLRGRRWLERVLANGYKNWKFGTALTPSSTFGVPVAFILSDKRAILDRQFRHLKARAGGRVLDVGFGDAAFLENARAMGWQAVGTDFDPKVVESARQRGLDARLGTVDALEGPFDVITMSHVIEHLHDPVAVLEHCHRLLVPGGTLWLETPNVEAMGLRRFGADWRGLEPPRHLVLFSRASLERALRAAGFSQVRDLRQPSVARGMYEVSNAISKGTHSRPTNFPLGLRLEVLAVKLHELLRPSSREFLGVVATKAPVL